MHQCGFPLLGHPPARTGAATRTGVSEHAGVCHGTAAKEESRSPVRGTEESDRAASLAFMTNKIRSGAVLPGSGGAEHQATGPVPKPTDSTTGSHHLDKEEKNSVALPQPRTRSIQALTFSTPTPDYANNPLQSPIGTCLSSPTQRAALR